MTYLRLKTFQYTLALFMFAQATVSAAATGAQLSCELAVTIAKGVSSETKNMVLVVIPLDSEFDQAQGTMTTVSCYGSFQEKIASNNSHLSYEIQGDLIEGDFNDSDLTMGPYEYHLSFHFAQTAKDVPQLEKVEVVVSGNISSNNDPAFAYNTVTGHCTLTKSSASPF